jgi:hypothetical protein
VIRDLVNNRYSGRVWEDKPISQEKIDYIVDCALNAPSKQCLYPWELHVITDSKAGKEFKDYLFWNDTWCENGLRANPNGVYSKNKRYNGQYRAPVLLVWTDRNPDLSVSPESPAFHKKESWATEQALIDSTVSSSFAMLAAEEQGLQTSFGRCHSVEWRNSVLGKGNKEFYIAVGIGYAPVDPNDPGEDMLVGVERNGVVDGFDTKNMNQNWPLERHSQRNHIPSRDELVKVV